MKFAAQFTVPKNARASTHPALPDLAGDVVGASLQRRVHVDVGDKVDRRLAGDVADVVAVDLADADDADEDVLLLHHLGDLDDVVLRVAVGDDDDDARHAGA